MAVSERAGVHQDLVALSASIAGAASIGVAPSDDPQAARKAQSAAVLMDRGCRGRERVCHVVTHALMTATERAAASRVARGSQRGSMIMVVSPSAMAEDLDITERVSCAFATASPDALIGRVLGDRYRIEDLIGEGSMGRVYRARHVSMSRRFAVKVMHGHLAADATMVRRFHLEAEATSRLSHRNIVGITDHGVDRGLYYLVTEYVDGQTLRQLIRTEGPLPTDQVMALTAQLCDGLAHAHDRGLVHRDLKPDNILIEREDHGVLARITDFGIARAGAPAGPRRRLTREGLILGTPSYMAPEQLAGDEIDPRADLYALGVVLYEMLAGTVPYAGSPTEVGRLQLLARLPSFQERVAGLVVDPLLEGLATWLLARRPELRPGSAREVGRIVRLLMSDRQAAAVALAVPVAMDTAETIDAVPVAREAGTGPTAMHRWPVEAPAASCRAAIAIEPLRTTVARPAVEPAPTWRRFLSAPLVVMLVAGVAGTVLSAFTGPVPAWPVAIAPPARTASSPPPAPGSVPDVIVAPLPVGPVPRIVEAPVVGPPLPVADEPRRLRAHRRRRGCASTSLAALRDQYHTVGTELDRLAVKRGGHVAAPLMDRYLTVSIVEALRDPSRAGEVACRLAPVRRSVRRALR